jgi:hypothetical protein
MAFDGVVTVNRAVTFPIDALPTLRSGDRMVIAGKTYSVRRALPRPDTDGSEWLAELVLLD